MIETLDDVILEEPQVFSERTESDAARNPATLISSKRFKITGREPLGEGAWGIVYPGIDLGLDGKGKREVAIKLLNPTRLAREQGRHRNLINPLTIIGKENIGFAPIAYVVHGRDEIDDNGTPFFVMEQYSGSLASKLGEKYSSRDSFANGNISKEKTIHIMNNVAAALSGLHNRAQRTYDDLKPDNILVTSSGDCHLADFGTSTSLAHPSGDPRDNLGCLYTRAPECFHENSRPEKCSDIWSFGALAYRLFTGKYPLEGELNNAKNPEEFMRNLDYKATNKLLRKRIAKNVPREFRKLLRDCLEFRSYERISDGKDLETALREAGDSMSAKSALKKHLTSTAKWLSAATILGGFVYAAALHEPTELKMPEIAYKGETYVGNPINGEQIKFEQENVPYKKPIGVHWSNGEDYDMIKMATNNKTVAYLASRYMRAALESRMLMPNDAQMAIYLAYHASTGGGMPMLDIHIEVPVRCIEYALNLAKAPSGMVDLEDMCVIATLGTAKWNEARKAANSFDYRDYSDAKGIDGEYIIPRDKKEFIDTWRGYIDTN